MLIVYGTDEDDAPWYPHTLTRYVPAGWFISMTASMLLPPLYEPANRLLEPAQLAYNSRS